MDVINHSVPVADLITAVKAAVKQTSVSSTDVDRDLWLASVQLTLNAVATTKVGGGLDFRVPVIGWKIGIGGNRIRQQTHTIHIDFIAEDLQDIHELRDSEIEDVLVDAITTIRHAVAVANNGDDPLVLRTGTVELAFAVTDEGSLSIGVEGELADEITHTLKVELIRARVGG